MPDNIPEQLAHLAVEIETLRPYPGNPRGHDIPMIQDSLQRHGQYRPLVVNIRQGTPLGDRTVLAGNGTLEAATGLGWDRIAVTYVDKDDDAAERIMLMDNRANDVAWYHQHDLLASLTALSATPDGLAGTGFTLTDLTDLGYRAAAPSLDALAEQYGEADDDGSTQWPIFSVRLPPELLHRFKATLASYGGGPHEQVAALLDAL